jgi:hypothetical protein
MIKGVKLWNSRECYYSQTNNPTEQMMRKRSDTTWLISCGPTAAVTCIAAMGYTVHCGCPGEYLPQSEEILMDFFHDPRNYEMLRRVRPDTPPETWYGNEVPQFYPIAVHAVFGVHGAFQFGHDFGAVAEKVRAGNAVQLCLIKPGHYIAALAYDEARREIIYNDPWPERFPDRNGFNRRMGQAEFVSNTKPFIISYCKAGQE